MQSVEEIAKTAYELYEKSGRAPNRDLDNWLEAERIMTNGHDNEGAPPAAKARTARAAAKRPKAASKK